MYLDDILWSMSMVRKKTWMVHDCPHPPASKSATCQDWAMNFEEGLTKIQMRPEPLGRWRITSDGNVSIKIDATLEAVPVGFFLASRVWVVAKSHEMQCSLLGWERWMLLSSNSKLSAKFSQRIAAIQKLSPKPWVKPFPGGLPVRIAAHSCSGWWSRVRPFTSWYKACWKSVSKIIQMLQTCQIL